MKGQGCGEGGWARGPRCLAGAPSKILRRLDRTVPEGPFHCSGRIFETRYVLVMPDARNTAAGSVKSAGSVWAKPSSLVMLWCSTARRVSATLRS